MRPWVDDDIDPHWGSFFLLPPKHLFPASEFPIRFPEKNLLTNDYFRRVFGERNIFTP